MSGYIGNIPVPQATQTRQSFTATASQTTFNTAGYSPGYVDVFLNGVKLAPADYTATNGSDVVLAVGAASGDILETVAYEIFQVLDQDFSGDFTVDGSTFVVDSTNDRVGVGTASPSTTLDLVGSWVSNTGQLSIDTPSGETYSGLAILNNGTPKGFLYHDNSAGALDLQTYTTDALRFKTNNAEAMRIDSSGKVIIGNGVTADAGTLLTVGGAATFTGQNSAHGASRIKIGQDTTAISQIRFYGADTSTAGILQFTGSSSDGTGGGERMRIDSSGNLLVGKTSTSSTTAGGNIFGGLGSFVRDGNTPLSLNRRTNDGEIVSFAAQDSAVGRIGSVLGVDLFVAGNRGAGQRYLLNNILPCNASGTINDNTLDLGGSANRYKDLYLSGGVYLGGTGSANKLDFYEEGTWTIVSGSGSNPLTVQGSGNRYTRIGRQVIAYFDIQWNSGNTGTASANISGLPFLPASNHEGDGAVTVGYITGSAGVDFVAHVSNSNSSFNFYANGSSGSNSYAQLAGRRIAGYVQYYTYA